MPKLSSAAFFKFHNSLFFVEMLIGHQIAWIRIKRRFFLRLIWTKAMIAALARKMVEESLEH